MGAHIFWANDCIPYQKEKDKLMEEQPKRRTDYEIEQTQLEKHHEASMVPEETVSKYTLGVYPENPSLPKHWPRCWMVHISCAVKRIERLQRLLILKRRK